MLGVNYESSDEEEELPATSDKVRLAYVPARASIATNIELANVSVTVAPTPEIPSQVTPHEPSLPFSAPVSGPAQGPTVSPPPVEDTSADDVAPGSPYTSNRATIQNLTLPTVPNFDIPPSPPGSPPQRATKKFAQFLELKKKGQHFNQRLEGSSVLRDPGHSQKLMDFAGISELQQYASTLSEELAVPTLFPRWAYVEELRASQKQMLKAKEQDRSKRPREAIDFVSATSSGTTSRTNTPGKASASQSVGKRKELEHRGREGSSLKSGRRSASRSPKRRR
ncbi:hypothetical protein N0V94_002740 [Neodidymelliopsis sp. IMI 364377]|nr:hypothetical protein N0V94_002740 [Neodidymelliopsis sp. IMI 364377]